MAGKQPKGLAEVQRSLGNAIRRMGEGADRGLVKAGLVVRKTAQENTPVRLGNLRSSAYVVNKEGDHGGQGAFKGPGAQGVASLTRSEKQLAQGLSVALDKARKPNVAVGFGAPYAVFVHENQNAGAAGYEADQDTPEKTAKAVHSKVGGAKFLERSLQSNEGTILRILAENVKV